MAWKFLWAGLILAVLWGVAMQTQTAAQTQAAFQAQAGVAQPIPFSHKQHAGDLKLKCAMCHANRDPGETMGVAAAAVCMQCHASIKADSPAIQKLASAVKDNRPVKWARVYEIPDYVIFSHRLHTTAGNTCTECHGQVSTRDQLFKEADLSMTGCMNCHKAKSASNDCQSCHEPRN